MYSLQDNVVLITGAANGIGACFVRLILNDRVKHVRILDVDEKSGVELQTELNQKYGDKKVKFVKCDVTNDVELFEAFDGTIKDFGYIDLVVNNAGISKETSSALRRKTVEVNLIGTIEGTLKAIELMRKDKGGRGGTIINISSIAALQKFETYVLTYSATKTGVLHFSNSIGLELSRLESASRSLFCVTQQEPFHSKIGVRVIAICYGITQTNILNGLTCYSEYHNVDDIFNLHPKQTPESAAKGTLEVFKKGNSGSTWLVTCDKPAKDITETLEKVFSDIEKILLD